MGYKNREGYSDFTAGIAIGHVSKKEREEKKMAKRSCRRSADENRIHEKAVKMRKMTDEQLVRYVEDRVEKARSEGFNNGKQKVAAPKIDLSSIVDEIGNVKGIGIAKLKEIKAILEVRLGEFDG